MKEFSEASTERVSAALLRQFDRVNELGMEKTGESRRTFRELSDVADDSRISRPVRQMAARTLALCVARTKTPAARRGAILYLGSAVANEHFQTPALGAGRVDGQWPLPFRSSEILSTTELADLNKRIGEQLGSLDVGPAAVAVKHWLQADAAGSR
jgi:hypothetical protein